MKSAIYMEGKRFLETEFKTEEQFEQVVKNNSKTIFGQKTIYFDIKNKIDSKSLGASIPDGFLFDFKDNNNPEFYLVEVELAKHSFYGHIFPQITKFLAFFNNPDSRSKLIEKLFSVVTSNLKLQMEFKQYLGNEIYKSLKDTIENSQNILIIIDENKVEFDEVMDIYKDTWLKKVKVEILKQYSANKQNIFTLNPDFEEIGLVEPISIEDGKRAYTESFHTEDIAPNITLIYEKIKTAISNLDANIKINPQRYYISLRDNKNFAFINLRKKKMHLVIMLPYEKGTKLMKHYHPSILTSGIQKFYNGPCFSVTLIDEAYLDEIITTLEEAYQQQK
ncbi:hypothetical protein J4437_03585 [Candidatus Woesearchaeota archaeon]|nr:hypothetical protein [Candidatus Woesearchaeota archaeon]